MIAFHATRDATAVLTDGWVRPARMKDVYAFTDRSAAEWYCQEFGYGEIVMIDVPKGSILARWTPSYCKAGRVLRIGRECRVVTEKPDAV